MSAQIISQPPEEIATVVRTRTEVLETMKRWILEGGGAQDALDDPQLHSSFISFLRHPTDHEPPDAVASDQNVQNGFRTINDSRTEVYASFTAQTMRPTVRAVPDQVTESSTSASYNPDPPDIDHIEPEELVGNLDAMAAATFRNVTQEVRNVALPNFNFLTSRRICSSLLTYWRCSPRTVPDGSPLMNRARFPMRWKSNQFICISRMSSLLP